MVVMKMLVQYRRKSRSRGFSVLPDRSTNNILNEENITCRSLKVNEQETRKKGGLLPQNLIYLQERETFYLFVSRPYRFLNTYLNAAGKIC
jgi:hypothetical protein